MWARIACSARRGPFRGLERAVGVDLALEPLEGGRGWTVERLAASLDRAHHRCAGLAPPLPDSQIRQLSVELVDPDGELMHRWKVFDRARLVAEVAPRLYGHHPASWTGWSTGSSPPSWSSPLVGRPCRRAAVCRHRGAWHRAHDRRHGGQLLTSERGRIIAIGERYGCFRLAGASIAEPLDREYPNRSVDRSDRPDMAHERGGSDSVREDQRQVARHGVESRVETASDLGQVGIHLRRREHDDGTVCWHAPVALARWRAPATDHPVAPAKETRHGPWTTPPCAASLARNPVSTRACPCLRCRWRAVC
jgi:hypothetical protein